MEESSEKNNIDHMNIKKALDENVEILKYIKEGIDARNWMRRWIKDWWLVLTLMAVIFVELFLPAAETWVRGLFENK